MTRHEHFFDGRDSRSRARRTWRFPLAPRDETGSGERRGSDERSMAGVARRARDGRQLASLSQGSFVATHTYYLITG
jgi:hypothetical protein